jgi:hypothetical protein
MMNKGALLLLILLFLLAPLQVFAQAETGIVLGDSVQVILQASDIDTFTFDLAKGKPLYGKQRPLSWGSFSYWFTATNTVGTARAVKIWYRVVSVSGRVGDSTQVTSSYTWGAVDSTKTYTITPDVCAKLRFHIEHLSGASGDTLTTMNELNWQ